MHKDWPEMAAGLSAPLKELRGGAPDVMNGFSALARAALEAKALDTKTKELLALGIAVAWQSTWVPDLRLCAPPRPSKPMTSLPRNSLPPPFERPILLNRRFT